MTITYSQEYFGKSSVNKRQGSCGGPRYDLQAA